MIVQRSTPAEGSPLTEGWVDVRLPLSCLADIIDALKGRPFPHPNEDERIALRKRTLRHVGVQVD